MQIVGILCRTPDKDARQEVLRRCAGGGGTFDKTGGGKVELPAVNLQDVANQAEEVIMVNLQSSQTCHFILFKHSFIPGLSL